MLRSRKGWQNKEQLCLLAIVVGGLALRLVLLPFEGRPADITDFAGWTRTIEQFGTHGLYAHAVAAGGHDVDYPPGYLWILTLIAHFDAALRQPGAAHDTLLRRLMKVPAIIADLGSALLIFALARRNWTEQKALIAAAIFTFSPTTWLISAYWGQVDSVAGFFLLCALLFTVSGRFPIAWLALAVAVLIKPQPLVVAPLLLAWQIWRQGWSARLIVPVVVGFGVAYVGSLPFAPSSAPGATLMWLLETYRNATRLYPYTSVSAANVYTVLGSFFESDVRVVHGLSIAAWGMLAFTLVLALIVAAFCKGLRGELPQRAPEPLLFTATFAALAALFVVTTRMHERYLFMALTVAPLLILAGRWERCVAVVMLATFTVNCLLVLFLFTTGAYHRGVAPLIHLISLLNVAALLTVVMCLTRFPLSGRRASPAIGPAPADTPRRA